MDLSAVDKRLTDGLDEVKIQTGAHAQVFSSTQSSVAQQSQSLATMQADAAETARRSAEELRSLTARLDHMRGEFSERVSHTFTEATGHADR